MPIIPNQDASLIVDQTAVNGNGNSHHPPEAEDPEKGGSDPGLDEDWGDIRRPPEDGHAPAVSNRWQDIGAYVAEQYLKETVVVRRDGYSGLDLTWQLRDGRLWELAPNSRGAIAERLLVLQSQIVQELWEAGSAAASKKVSLATYEGQVTGQINSFWAGANVVLRRGPLPEPPLHLVNTPAGVRDLQTGRTHPMKEVPYLFTSCTNGDPGSFLDGCLNDSLVLVEDHLRPSLPDARDRHNLLKGWAQAFGGQGGGMRPGSILGSIGKSGGGKGWSQRFCEDSLGGYCIPADEDALMSKAILNDHKARILERNPRLINLSEVTRVSMELINRLTGRDPLSARGPYAKAVGRRLFCAVSIASVVAPRGRADTGMERRLFCIRFPQVAEVSFADATDETSQEMMDALVATLIGIAEEMWQQGDDWEGLPKNDPFTLECLRRADPVLELAMGLTAADHGRHLSNLSKELHDIGCRPQHGQLADAIRETGNWEVRRCRHLGEPPLNRIIWKGTGADGSEGG